MKTIALFLVLLAGTASAQQPGTQSYTPDRKTEAPTFMNAEVVRVNRAANTVTFRSESGETALTVEGEALSALNALRPGDKVVVGYRIVKDASGRETRIVTSVTTASPTSGEPDRRGAVASLRAGSTVRARVLSYDAQRRRVPVIDESGGLRALPVNRGIAGIDSLQPGSNVALNLGAVSGGAAGALNVSGITSLGNTPVFANGVGFPPVNGQVVGFNQRTGLLTLDTPTAGRVSFPVGTGVAGGLSGVQPGQNLSLTFDVTNAANQARGAVGTAGGGVSGATGSRGGVPLAQITGVQPFIPNAQLVNAAGAGGVSPVSPNTASINAPGLAGTPGVPGGVGNQGVAGAAGTPGGIGNTAGVTTAGVPGTTAGGTGAAGAGGAGTGTAGTGAGGTQAGGAQGGGQAVGGGQVVGGTVGGGVATSPFVNPVPSIPGVTPQQAAVLPPAQAKAPLSADEVGTQRAAGEADLANSAVAMAQAANAIDAVWAGFKNQCLRGSSAATNNPSSSGREWYVLAEDRVPTPTDDACRSLHADLMGRAQGFLSQLDTVEDAARRADVLPARVREVFERHRLR